jgi:activating signal cointegrator complex subunit 3
MHYFDQTIKNNLEIKDLTLILSNAEEFNEIPVRHNEDIMNENLAKLVPFSVDVRSYDSPNTKTHLLLQAHFSRCPLPIRYLQFKSILEII